MNSDEIGGREGTDDEGESVTVTKDLLFKAVKEMRELRKKLPVERAYAVERHNLKIKELLLNNLLSNGHLAIEHLIDGTKLRAQQLELVDELEHEDEA